GTVTWHIGRTAVSPGRAIRSPRRSHRGAPLGRRRLRLRSAQPTVGSLSTQLDRCFESRTYVRILCYARGMELQGSLLDLVDDPGLAPLSKAERIPLSRGAWVDVLPGWLTGADSLFERLAAEVPWRAERRQMDDRVVD